MEKVTENEPKGFLNPGLTPRGLLDPAKTHEEIETQTSSMSSRTNSIGGASGAGPGSPKNDSEIARKSSGKRLRDFVKGLTGNNEKREEDEDEGISHTPPGPRVEAIEARSETQTRRVLYTANVGDARAVLW